MKQHERPTPPPHLAKSIFAYILRVDPKVTGGRFVSRVDTLGTLLMYNVERLGTTAPSALPYISCEESSEQLPAVNVVTIRNMYLRMTHRGILQRRRDEVRGTQLYRPLPAVIAVASAYNHMMTASAMPSMPQWHNAADARGQALAADNGLAGLAIAQPPAERAASLLVRAASVHEEVRVHQGLLAVLAHAQVLPAVHKGMHQTVALAPVWDYAQPQWQPA